MANQYKEDAFIIFPEETISFKELTTSVDLDY